MKSKVYFTKEITPDSLIKIYEILGVELKGTIGKYLLEKRELKDI